MTILEAMKKAVEAIRDWVNDKGYITSKDIPESLKNPSKLSFTGAVEAEYDGSEEVTVNIPEALNGYELPTASAETLGGVKIGDGLAIDENGVVSADEYELPIASAEALGGIKIGDGLEIDADGILSTKAEANVQADWNESDEASDAYILNKPTIPEEYVLPAATAAVLGGIKIGDGMDVSEDGVLSVGAATSEKDGLMSKTDKEKIDGIEAGAKANVQADWNEADTSSDAYIANKPNIPDEYTLPIATAEVLGGVKVGSGLDIAEDGAVSVAVATAEKDGLMAKDDKSKLDGIEAEADKNVQADWNEADTASDAYILNKPTIPEEYTLPMATDAILGGVKAGEGLTIAADGTASVNIAVATSEKDGLMAKADKEKLDGVASGAEVNVQSDWNETDESSDAYIANKPTIPDEYTLPTASTTVLGGVKVGDGLSISEDGIVSVNVSKASSEADGIMAKEDKAKLDAIAAGAEVNVQSDWSETSEESDAYIANKPESLKNPNKIVFSGAVTAEYDGSAEVSVEIPVAESEITVISVGAITETAATISDEAVIAKLNAYETAFATENKQNVVIEAGDVRFVPFEASGSALYGERSEITESGVTINVYSITKTDDAWQTKLDTKTITA